ncbi:hypothetical protein quinque_008772 [Culex quinquefasciatus]
MTSGRRLREMFCSAARAGLTGRSAENFGQVNDGLPEAMDIALCPAMASGATLGGRGGDTGQISQLNQEMDSYITNTIKIKFNIKRANLQDGDLH